MAFLDKCTNKIKPKNEKETANAIVYSNCLPFTITYRTHWKTNCTEKEMEILLAKPFDKFNISIIIKHWFLHLVQFILEQFCKSTDFVVSTRLSDICSSDIVWPSCTQYAHCTIQSDAVFLSNEYNFISVRFFSISPFALFFHSHQSLSSFTHSLIHPFILFPIAFKSRQPLSNAKQINNNLFVTNDCYFTHLNKIASYVQSALQGAYSHALIHKTKVVCKIYSHFALTHVKVAACIHTYVHANKTNSIHFISFENWTNTAHQCYNFTSSF